MGLFQSRIDMEFVAAVKAIAHELKEINKNLKQDTPKEVATPADETVKVTPLAIWLNDFFDEVGAFGTPECIQRDLDSGDTEGIVRILNTSQDDPEFKDEAAALLRRLRR